MPRARNLKPKFFRDSKVVKCSFEARLLFQGLWCLADYMGRLRDDAFDIKIEIFPADNVDVEKCMCELADVGLIQRYQDDSGSPLVQIRKFTEHQNPHMNERQDSKGKPAPHLPGPDDVGQGGDDEKPTKEQRVRDATRVLLEYYQSDPADSLNLIPSSLFQREGASDDGPPAPKKPKSKKGHRIPEGFPAEDELAWAAKEYPAVNAKAEAEKFRDYWKGVPGQKGTKLDWPATWRNWIRRSVENSGMKGQPDMRSPAHRNLS